MSERIGGEPVIDDADSLEGSAYWANFDSTVERMRRPSVLRPASSASKSDEAIVAVSSPPVWQPTGKQPGETLVISLPDHEMPERRLV